MPQSWKLTLTIMDAKEQLSQHLIYLAFEQLHLILDPQENPFYFAQYYARALDILIEGQITAITLSLSVDLPVELKTIPDAYSDVEEGAEMKFSTVEGYDFSHRIPTFREEYYGVDDKTVDEDEMNAASQYTLLMTNAIEMPEEFTIYPVERRGDRINNYRFGEKSFTSSRRAR